MDYDINQVGENFKVCGDTPTEVMDKGLYQEGDVFVVKNGWLVKMDKLEQLFLGEANGRDKPTSRSD